MASICQDIRESLEPLFITFIKGLGLSDVFKFRPDSATGCARLTSSFTFILVVLFHVMDAFDMVLDLIVGIENVYHGGDSSGSGGGENVTYYDLQGEEADVVIDDSQGGGGEEEAKWGLILVFATFLTGFLKSTFADIIPEETTPINDKSFPLLTFFFLELTVFLLEDAASIALFSVSYSEENGLNDFSTAEQINIVLTTICALVTAFTILFRIIRSLCRVSKEFLCQLALRSRKKKPASQYFCLFVFIFPALLLIAILWILMILILISSQKGFLRGGSSVLMVLYYFGAIPSFFLTLLMMQQFKSGKDVGAFQTIGTENKGDDSDATNTQGSDANVPNDEFVPSPVSG